MFIAVHHEDKSAIGNWPEYGEWMNWYLYDLPNDLVPRLNLLGIQTVVFEDSAVAAAWKFALIKRDHIKVHPDFGGVVIEQLGADNPRIMPYKPNKAKYMLTEADFANGVKFAKEIIKAIAYRGYQQMWELQTSALPLWHAAHSTESHSLKLELVNKLLEIESKLEAATTQPEVDGILYELVVDLNPTGYPVIDGESDVQRSTQPETE